MIYKLPKIDPTKVVFFVVFLLLAFFASKLHLYLDDAYFLYPSLKNEFISHFRTYTSYYSIFRPATLIYYYFIFALYRITPFVSHLIPLGLFIFSLIFIYKVLFLQGFSRRHALLTSIFIGSLPFATETYAWFAASSAIISFLIFWFQVYLIERYNPTRKLLFTIFILQTLSVFTYESAVVLPFFLGFLWLKKRGVFSKNRLMEYFKVLLFLGIPEFVYLISRIVIPAKVETRIKIIGIKQIITNWMNFAGYFRNVFINKETFSLYWYQEGVRGLQAFLENPMYALILVLFISSLLYIAFYDEKENLKPDRSISKVWLFGLLCALFPLSWQNNYLPFRVLFLPYSLLIVLVSYQLKKCAFVTSNMWIKLTGLLTLIFIISWGFVLQVQMMRNYNNQYLLDKKAAIEIEKIVTQIHGDHLYDRTNVFLINIPNNMLWSFVYGDYLLTSFYHPWVAEYFLYLQTGVWENIAVELESNSVYKGTVDKSDFLTKRPLTVLRYSGHYNCLYKECFQLEASYK